MSRRLDQQSANRLFGRVIDGGTPADGDRLVWDATLNKWKYAAAGAGAGGLDPQQIRYFDEMDARRIFGRVIDGGTPTDGDAIIWDAALNKWKYSAPAGSTATDPLAVWHPESGDARKIFGRVIDGSTPSDGNIIVWDATLNKWKYSAPSSGGDSTYTAAYGSRPAASNAGDLFFPNDGFVLQRDTGAAWVPWGPIFPFTQPVNADFSWINQGGASVTDDGGGIFLTAPAGAGHNVRIRKKSQPSAPYTIDTAFLSGGIYENYTFRGIGWRESSSGALVVLSVRRNDAIYISKFSDPNNLASNYLIQNFYPGVNLIWFRIEDDTSNRICSWSTDGQNWQQLHSVGNTDYLTADEVFFFTDSNNATFPCDLTLLHWLEA